MAYFFQALIGDVWAYIWVHGYGMLLKSTTSMVLWQEGVRGCKKRQNQNSLYDRCSISGALSQNMPSEPASEHLRPSDNPGKTESYIWQLPFFLAVLVI